MNCEEYIIKRLTSLESEKETLHKLLSMKQAEINAAKSQTGETKTEIEYNGFREANVIGETVDVVIDKKGREWPIVRLHEGIAGFRDCPFCARFDENGDTNVYEDATIKKVIDEWCDENMTPEQRERYGKPFLASLYQIKGEKALKFVKKSEGEVQFDYYKDPHNQLKMCPDYWEDSEYDYVGAPYWTSSPNAGNTYSVRYVYNGGNMYNYSANNYRGVAPCFAIINNPLSVETAARPSGTETKKPSKKAKVEK